jgi:nitroreductase
MSQLPVEKLSQLLETRRSVRRFEPEALPPQTGQRLVSAAITAPTAGNVQPWHFVLVEARALRERLCEAALSQSQVAEAPLVVVVCVDLERTRRSYGRRGETLYALQDTAAATQNMLLMAHAMGLGSCWVGAFDERRAAQAIDLDPRFRPVALVPVGIPAEKPAGPGRRSVGEISEKR